MHDCELSVIEVAAQLGKRKQLIFKVMKRLGINASLQRSRDARGQKIAVIQSADYKRLKEYFLMPSDMVPEANNRPTFDSSTLGRFYLIQLEPTHDPGRFKLGFASNLEERLRAHRTAAPLSRMVKSWPCKLLWEKTAIESVSFGYERLHTEVFRAADIHEVLLRCEKFFDVMPNEVG